jgi:hypothetical protein
MGIILQFQRREATVPAARRPENDNLGEIIIFPGVRIERRISSGRPQGSTGLPQRKRRQRARKK